MDDAVDGPISEEEGYVMRGFWIGYGVVLDCASNYTLAQKKKKKKKEADLYSAFIEHSRRSGTDHTVLPANYTVPASTS